jgi:hypothetical protein
MSEFDPTSLISDEEKAAIANDRVNAAARDAYGHVLNREKALAADPNADTTDIDNALEMLTKAVKHTANKADRLVAERVVE